MNYYNWQVSVRVSLETGFIGDKSTWKMIVQSTIILCHLSKIVLGYPDGRLYVSSSMSHDERWCESSLNFKNLYS